ncbi:hypothetical protein ES702_07158 [subsurface metagenome]
MINKGFSDKDIGRMVDVPGDVIKNFRGGKNVQTGDVKTGRRSNESTKHGGGDQVQGNDRDQNPGREPGDQNNNHPSPGESTPSKTGEGITFIGGKKDMDKKEGSGAKEEDEYQCYNCDYTQGSPFSECPKCGKSNTFDE